MLRSTLRHRLVKVKTAQRKREIRSAQAVCDAEIVDLAFVVDCTGSFHHRRPLQQRAQYDLPRLDFRGPHLCGMKREPYLATSLASIDSRMAFSFAAGSTLSCTISRCLSDDACSVSMSIFKCGRCSTFQSFRSRCTGGSLRSRRAVGDDASSSSAWRKFCMASCFSSTSCSREKVMYSFVSDNVVVMRDPFRVWPRKCRHRSMYLYLYKYSCWQRLREPAKPIRHDEKISRSRV